MNFPSPPRGLKAIPWRLPIYLYKAGLGWLLGGRFLLLHHKGRNSGLIRSAVLEVVHHLSGSNTYLVVSGFGDRSDWYQNILKDPKVEIQVGRKQLKALASQLGPDEAGVIILAYYENNPSSLRTLSNLMGYQIEFTTEGMLEFGRRIPVIQFSVEKEEHK